MNRLILCFFILISHLESSPVDRFNEFILQDLIYKQVSLNDKKNKIDESYGVINRLDSHISILVEKPFKERYLIFADVIEIYDFDFNQTRIIEINENDLGVIVDFLKNGIDDQYDISNMTNKSFNFIKDEKNILINFLPNEDMQISFLDNIGIKNLITFSKI